MIYKPLYFMGKSKPSYWLDANNVLISNEDFLKIPIADRTVEDATNNLKQKNLEPILEKAMKNNLKGCIYSMGSMDLQRTCSSFTGVDAILVTKRNGVWNIWGSVQYIAHQSNRNGLVAMDKNWTHQIEIVNLILDGRTIDESFQIEELFVFCANEYGKIMVFLSTKKPVLLSYSSGIGINDIVVEEKLIFTSNNLQTVFTKEEVDAYASIINSTKNKLGV